MSAFGREARRRLRALACASAAVTFAAGLASAVAGPAAVPVATESAIGGGLLSPESPVFGNPEHASSLVALFNAPHRAEIAASAQTLLAPALFARVSPDLTPVAEVAPFGAAPGDSQAPTPEANPAPTITAPSSVALSPMQSALKAALERLAARPDRANPLGAGDWRAARAAIAAFYAARGYTPVWVSADGLTSAARAVLSQLERAGEDGLDLAQFSLPRSLASGPAEGALAEAETTIAAAVVAYAEQASGSRAPPARISPLVTMTPSVADPGAALAEVAAASDPARRLADFNPPQKGYRDLREELARLTEAAEGEAELPPAAPASVASIEPTSAASTRADVDPAANAALQIPASHRSAKPPVGGRGAAASGDPALARASRARRRAAIIANMEMWRWEPRDMGERRIEVNVADFSAALLEGDTVIHQTRVIVGKPETPTPIFSNVMRYILINPSWQVPDSIIKKEMLSKLGYLSQHGYEVKTVGGRLTVRQLPGDGNALGRLAFMFPNEHSVYLHDTPARQLFAQETRAFSHGCIRVENPLSLAQLVLEGDAKGWSAERIEAAYGGPERTVMLPKPLPIHIEYFTEFTDESGEPRERPDVYGLARRVEGMISTASQD